MAVDFSFGQVEAVCAAMQDISSDKRTAFTSRLKHLIKTGIFNDERLDRPGRGFTAKFTFSQLMKMAIGVELLQAGTPPSLASKLIQGNWLQLRVGVYFALYNEIEKRASGEPREETYWILAPEALRELSKAGESEWDHYEAFESVYRTEDLAAHLAGHASSGFRGHYRRQLILNGTAITRAAAFLIAFELNIASIQDLRDSIYGDIKEDQERLERAMKDLPELREVAKDVRDKRAAGYLSDFEQRMKARAAVVMDKLSPSQMAIMAADEGSQVELMPEDLVYLRKLDLIGIQQGEIVITELGQEVAEQVRRAAGQGQRSSPKNKAANPERGRHHPAHERH